MVRTAPHIGFMALALTSLFSVRLPALIAVLLAMSAAVPAAADQNDPRLDSLFEALQKTSSEAEIQLLTSQIWDRWTAFENDSGTYLMMVTGMQLMNSGQLAQAEGVFTQIIAAQPDFAEAWNKRATVRFMRGDDDGSRQDIVEVIDREPRHFGALSGLGMIHLRNGNLQGALQAFEAALRVNPHLDMAETMITRLTRELARQAGDHGFRHVQMRIYPQCRFKCLQGTLQIAVAQMDHTKTGQCTEMARLTVNHLDNILTRPVIITAHETYGCPFVPRFGKVWLRRDDLRKDALGLRQLPAIHQLHTGNHHKIGSAVIFESGPAVPDLAGQQLNFSLAAGFLQCLKKAVEAWIILVCRGWYRSTHRQQNRNQCGQAD